MGSYRRKKYSYLDNNNYVSSPGAMNNVKAKLMSTKFWIIFCLLCWTFSVVLFLLTYAYSFAYGPVIPVTNEKPGWCTPYVVSDHEILKGEVIPLTADIDLDEFFEDVNRKVLNPIPCINSRETRGEWRVENNFACASVSPDRDDVTVLTQFTVDRLDSFLELATLWKGPISASVYLENATIDLAILSEILDSHGSGIFQKTDWHIVGSIPNAKYPVNFLRNVALRNSRTEYVILLDVDFIPNPDMYSQLKASRNVFLGGEVEDRKACVVPAFELKSGSTNVVSYPKSKSELYKKFQNEEAYQVHLYKGKHSHFATHYDRWIVSNSPYEIFYDYTYEPYVMVRKSQIPMYDERFAGYGNDKTSAIYELMAAKFKFFVLPQPFIIHKDHGEPSWRKDQGSATAWRKWAQFVRDIKWKYNGFVFDVPDWLKDDCRNGDCPEFWHWF